MDLTKRQKAILKSLVERFTCTAEPVGSKTLIPLLDFSVSSATIRNELALLEKEGLLEKTHLSSGRVPSPKGYRYYVENLMEISLDENTEKTVRAIFSRRHGSLEDLTKISCSILSEMTHLTSVVIEPEQSRQTLVQLSLIPVSDRQAVAVVITSSGQTEHRLFSFDNSISLEDLKRCTDLLNERLKGIPIEQLADRFEEMRPEFAAHVGRREVLFEAFMSAVMGFASGNPKVYGRANMLAQPEFTSMPRLEELMRILENERLFFEWTTTADSVAAIDERSKLIQIGDCSIVSSAFHTLGDEKGQLMVIGPNRMDYARVLGLMDYLSEQIEKTFGPENKGGQCEQESVEKNAGSGKEAGGKDIRK